MKYVLPLLLLTACSTATPIQGHSGAATTGQYLDPKSKYAVSPQDTPSILSDGGARFGEALKDINEDIGKAAKNSAKFINKL